ncbi:hypothetical protein QYS46_21475 [Klebsiella michiganensis]|nr:hypothetical protein [Klebsiella michiganensis]
MPNDPKKEDIEKFFECDPENGLIKRAINSGVAKAGEVPVSINNCGYHMVCALGRI